MKNYIPWYIPVGPADKSIIIDGENNVLFSDIPAHEFVGDRSLLNDQEFPGQDIEAIARKQAAKQKLHLLDILDSKGDALRAIAAAYDRPNHLVEREIIFYSERKRARIMHIEAEGEKLRTIILICPIK